MTHYATWRRNVCHGARRGGGSSPRPAALLEDRRFRELTVEDVMAEAGLARTIFYRHFEGLPDLVLAALDDVVIDDGRPAAPTCTTCWSAP